MNDSPISGFLNVPCAHCGEGIELPAQAADMEVQCPHCGWLTPVNQSGPANSGDSKTQTNPAKASVNSRRPLFAALGTVIVLAVAAILLIPRWRQPAVTDAGGRAATQAPAAPAIPLPSGLAVSPVTLQATPGTSLRHAVGAVTNATSHQRFGLKITVALLDNQGDRLGASSDYRDVLDPGAVWNFKALVTFPKTASAKLEGLSEEEE